MDYKQKLNELLLTTARQNASDLHLAVGRHPTLRIDGILIPLQKEAILTPEAAENLIFNLFTPEQKDKFLKEREIDFSYGFEDKARFRINVFYQRGYIAAALRLIPAQIKNIEGLNLPPILHDFTKISQGFFLVVGPAGH
jgi:twitching motility protein PilT